VEYFKESTVQYHSRANSAGLIVDMFIMNIGDRFLTIYKSA
jgi:hypothetical protein